MKDSFCSWHLSLRTFKYISGLRRHGWIQSEEKWVKEHFIWIIHRGLHVLSCTSIDFLSSSAYEE